MSKLIFIIGKKRSGKDTTADYITNNFNAKKYQLAKPIKDALFYAFRNSNISKLHDISRDNIEGIDYDREQNLHLTKEDVCSLMMKAMYFLDTLYRIKGCKFYEEQMCFESANKIKRVINKIEDDFSVRRLMQALGTDIMVNVFDEMYWVMLFCKVYLANFNKCDYFIVSDTRQNHELMAARAMGATVVHVVRSSNDINIDNHITERGLPVHSGDTVINNDGSIEELFQKINKVL